MDEQQWITALRQSDGNACRRLVEAYSRPLFAFFRGLGFHGAAAEDLLQETFLELWRSLAHYRGEASPKTWVFLIGRRLAWKQLKQPTHTTHTHTDDNEDPLATDLHDLPPNQEDWLWVHQRREVLHQCIHTLPPLYREILLLHYMEELTFQEMAAILAIAQGTTKSRLHKALTLLRTEILRHFKQDATEISENTRNTR